MHSTEASSLCELEEVGIKDKERVITLYIIMLRMNQGGNRTIMTGEYGTGRYWQVGSCDHGF